MTVKFVDLSGYMFTGKSAVSDVIREFRGFHVPDYRDEFDLIRVPGGLGDLLLSVEVSWSPIRVDQAIRRFERVVRIMARSPVGICRLYQEGFGYSKKYPGIEADLDEFIKGITECQWDMPWPYAIIEKSGMPFEVFSRKLYSHLKGQLSWPVIHHRIAGKKVFMQEAKRFLANVLSRGVGRDCHTVVMHNALEPFNPQSLFGLFDEIKCIVVDRDPRDIFATGAMSVPKYNDGDLATSKKISASFDPKVFVEKHAILRANTNYQPHANVLRMEYEELIYTYEEAINKICLFLEVSPSEHTHKKQYFDPERSKQNVGLWKKHQNQNDIDEIVAAFPERCRKYS